jgi:predicted DNA-binding transcriptional regulator YafY
VDAGPPDLALKRAKGAIALRRTRLSRLLAEAGAQGAAPSVAQPAEALDVGARTIQRDLAALRREDAP